MLGCALFLLSIPLPPGPDGIPVVKFGGMSMLEELSQRRAHLKELVQELEGRE